MLTDLQLRLAGILRTLPEAEEFALAGGAALISRGLIDRPTRDLDYFATTPQAVDRLLPALRSALDAEGLTTTVVRDSPGFVRMEVSDGSDHSEIDLSHDHRLFRAEAGELGLVLAADELAADKVLALFGRAEARDFLDVERLLQVSAPTACSNSRPPRTTGSLPLGSQSRWQPSTDSKPTTSPAAKSHSAGFAIDSRRGDES